MAIVSSKKASNTWLQSAALYKEPRILSILFLGFSSGLPFLLTLATLHVWLTEVGVTKSTIGLFAAVTLPYSFKFIWAPMIDRLQLPILGDVFGHQKSWMLFSQVMLVITLIALGRSDPTQHIGMTALCAFLVSLFSATQDICTEAYRVQKLPHSETGIGAGASHLGYRLGMWVSGAGALYLASSFSWSAVYAMMAGCMVLGMITVLLSHEPEKEAKNDMPHSMQNADHRSSDQQQQTVSETPLGMPYRKQGIQKKSFGRWLYHLLSHGVSQTMLHLRERGDLVTVIGFIFLFKLVDTYLNAMTVPFLLEIGFDKVDIANVGKSFGIGAMIIGGLMAGVLLTQFSLRKTIVLCCGLQFLSAIAFFVQSQVGNNIYVLFMSIGLDNFANGMSFAAFVAYLSVIAKGRHAGTHFAFLTSIASFARVVFSYLAGVNAEHMAWGQYYLLTAVLCFPLLLVVALKFRSVATVQKKI